MFTGSEFNVQGCDTFAKRPLLSNFCVPAERDLRYATAAQISILEILNVFLCLKSSSSLNLNKIECFAKVSLLFVGVHRFRIQKFKVTLSLLTFTNKPLTSNLEPMNPELLNGYLST